jgi:hypothetical protein
MKNSRIMQNVWLTIFCIISACAYLLFFYRLYLHSKKKVMNCRSFCINGKIIKSIL